MSDTQTVIGTVAGITEKPSGWMEVQVSMPGKQYPVKLSTKKEELIAAVRELGTGVAEFSYTEVESEKINPNSGKPYINRYLEAVAHNAGGMSESTSPRLPDPVHAPLLGGDKDRAITRMACLKSAAQIVAGGEYEDPGLETMKQAARFEIWIYRDLEPPPFE